MIICGIKLTHDAAIALIDNGKLIFSYEAEKNNNNLRHSVLDLNVEEIAETLKRFNYRIDQIDSIVIDGWGSVNNVMAFNDMINTEKLVNYRNDLIDLADYGHFIVDEDILKESLFTYKDLNIEYKSYMHVSGHVFGAYCTSPFSKDEESSFILIWDGGMPPQLFYYDPKINMIKNLGPLFLINGFIYIWFPQRISPFSDIFKKGMSLEETERIGMSIPGKVMAYIALGNIQKDLLSKFNEIYNDLFKIIENVELNSEHTFFFTRNLIDAFVKKLQDYNYEPADILATFHKFLENLLIKNLSNKIKRYEGYTRNLCFSGGSALNIKWNSEIRNSGIFKNMWVPPFCNDSGNAIGTACCEMVKYTGIRSLNWNVYSGQKLNKTKNFELWKSYHCTVGELAELIYLSNEPVIILNERAELGPRALGNRSIVASTQYLSMKNYLNKIKQRESYRPVSPICLEEDAPSIFTPGIPDPYMLYDHQIKIDWKDKIPAVCHLDGSARLQTVNQYSNPMIYKLLKEYKRFSGIPVLCNTSANFKGKGFFPDVDSAMAWGEANLIWNDNNIFIRDNENKILELLSLKENRIYCSI